MPHFPKMLMGVLIYAVLVMDSKAIAEEAEHKFDDESREQKTCLENKCLKLSKSHLDVEIIPELNEVQSHSIAISWDAKVESNSNFTGNVGLKMSYRPFGSILEREVTLLMKPKDNSNNFEVISEYTIDHLLPNTGYELCFSIHIEDSSKFLGDEENKNRGLSEKNERRRKYFTTQETRNEDATTSTTEESEVFINNFQAVNQLPRLEEQTQRVFVNNYFPTAAERQNPSEQYFPNFPSLPLITQGIHRPFRNSDPSNDPPASPGARENFAYSSSGDLIYLPSNQWNPYKRDKRSLTIDKIEEVTSFKDKRSKICQEVLTKFTFSALLSPLNILIASILFIGTVPAILFTIYFARKSYRSGKCITCCSNVQHKTRNLEDEFDDNFTGSLEKRKQMANVLARESAKKSKSFSFKSKKCNCDQVSKAKLSLKKSGDSEFHDGYDIPPSSTVGVYGYDFPKPSNKSNSPGPLSAAASSCELNDQYSSEISSWEDGDMSSKNNFDISSEKSKQSEANKVIATELLDRELYPKSQKYYACYAKNITSEDISLANAKPRTSNELQNKNYNIKKGLVISPVDLHKSLQEEVGGIRNTESSGVNDNSKVPKKQSVGDIVVTGGTLIEVPEGYVLPPKNPRPVEKKLNPDILRILIHGESSSV